MMIPGSEASPLRAADIDNSSPFSPLSSSHPPKNIRRMKSTRLVISLLLLTLGLGLHAAESSDSTATAAAPRRHGLVGRVIQYFDEANKPKPQKKVDFSIIGGPSYSNDAKFGLGLVAAAIYRPDMTDSTLMPSNVSLYGEVTTAMLYLVGIRGNHIAPHDRFRVNYNVNFFSFPTKFWGIGYEKAMRSINETDYKEFRLRLQGEFLYNFGHGFYAGPEADFYLIRAGKVDESALPLWEGESLRTTSVGAGIVAAWDTRDNLTAPTSGWYIRAEQKFFPRFMGNGNYSFSLTEVGINKYAKVWRGGVLAGRLHVAATYGHTPWGLLPTVGGSYTMRGYYEARYRDKTSADFTLELRQHVWRRSGIAVWVGVGAVEPSLAKINIHKLLPNAGIGYRWEFKKNTNVRLDFGIGRHTTGFVFNINEAF